MTNISVNGLRPLTGSGRKLYIETYGCQMNVHESEKIAGILKKLDYIKSLGVYTIYLSPIFYAASNHKYDTGDYTRIDEMFGGEDAFDNLIAKAKEKFNHFLSESLSSKSFRSHPPPSDLYNDIMCDMKSCRLATWLCCDVNIERCASSKSRNSISPSV